jgi:hypothetical protein
MKYNETVYTRNLLKNAADLFITVEEEIKDA